MSFVGQFGPTFKCNRGIRRFSDSGVYALGVLLSSVLFILVLDTAGSRFAVAAGPRGSMLAALVLSGVLIVVDGLRLWGGRSTPLGLNRQTPHAWRLRGRIGVLGWGLDTGLPVSTVRATPLPALGVILTATGHAGPLHGLFYGCGVTLGALAGLLARRSDERIDQSMDRLIRRHRAIGPARLILLPSGVIVAVLAASLAGVL